jgi:O-antigen ligase
VATASTQDKLSFLLFFLLVLSLFFGSNPSESLDTNPGKLAQEVSIKWFHAPILLSLAMGGLFLLPFWFNSPVIVFRNFWYRKELVLLSMVCLYLLTGYFYPGEHAYLNERLKIKLPFLLLPLAAGTLSLSAKDFKLLVLLFCFFTCVVTSYVLINYVMRYNEINEAYIHSKVMPTPMNHIRFSILVAIAAYLCYWLAKEYRPESSFRFIAMIMCAYLFAFLHLYAVRSGLIALYGVVIAEVVMRSFVSGTWRKGAVMIALIALPVALLLHFSPTIKKKIENTKADLLVYKNSGYANYNSLSTRLISYEIAFEIFKKNMLFGCGPGNIESESRALFKSKHPEITVPIIPHNEFLYYLAATGLTGLIIFMLCFFGPLFLHKNYRNKFLVIIYLVLFLSFMSEPMIETQLGVACTLIFLLLPFLIREGEKAHTHV